MAVTSVALVTSATAQRQGKTDRRVMSATSTVASPSVKPTQDGGLAGISGMDQNFEVGFTPGPGCGQNGWGGFCGTGVGFTIVDNGSPDPVYGQFSALHISDGSGIAGNEVIAPTSATSGEVGVLEMDVQISDTLSTYGISTAPAAGTIINTRVFFQAGGSIDILQLLPGSCTQGQFVASGATWTAATTFRLGIEVDGLGELKVYKDGALIFTGDDISVACAPAGPQGIGNLSVFASNLAGAATTLRLDNLAQDTGSSCAGDTNLDGTVNVTDLLAVIGAWGATGANAADINGDLVVNVTDLLAVIGAWGPCP
jgi:hypothetical protein